MFFYALLAGAVCYILAASFGITGLKLHLIPVISMILYAVFVWFSPKSKRDVSDADNAYYMGFIFTMISLGLALYQIETDINNNINVSKLVQSFGIALSSTIVGIFLRILISPKRQDIDAEETSARAALQESVLGFSKVLDESTQNIKVSYESHVSGFTQTISRASDTLVTGIGFFNTKASSVFHEMIDLLEKSLPKTLDNVNESFSRLSESVERNTQKIQNTLDVQFAAILKTNELIKEHSDRLETSSKIMVQALGTLTDKISNVAIDKHTVEKHVESVFLVYESASKIAADSLIKSTETLRIITEELTELPIKLDIYIEAKDRQQIELKTQIEHSFLNVSDLLNRNVGLFQNLPYTLESKIRPLIETIDDSKKILQHLQSITPAIDDAKKSLFVDLDAKISSNNNLISNIYSATYEILQILKANKLTNPSPTQEIKSPTV